MTSWSKKRPGAGKFTPDNIDATLCTHVIYAFASIKDHRLVEGEDKEGGKDNEKEGDRYKQVVALREKNPDLKVSLFTVVLKLTWRIHNSCFNHSIPIITKEICRALLI